MAITYHNRDCSFTLKGKQKTSLWITQTAKEEGFRIGEIAIVLCSDSALLEINKEYLAHDYLTDIITFDYSEAGIISGDLMISVDTVADNALIFGQQMEQELMRVIIHGILHLCGYGDKTEAQEKQMREMESKYLAKR